MKNNIVAIVLLVLGLCSCHGNSGKLAGDSSATISSLGVNDTLVMKYVTCSKITIDTLFAKGDSVYAQTNKYSIENLGLDNEEYNKWLVVSYGDTIPVIVSIYDTYDRITGCGEDFDTNASFIWHEVAKMQITKFIQKDGRKATKEDIDKVFNVVDGILSYYAGGTQYEMNMVAARWLLVADYRLLDAYKQLMDCYPSAEIRKLVHKDYKYMFDTGRKYMQSRYERDRYSDLPRELRCMFYDILTAKTASINRLIETRASEQMVVKNLCEHNCLENGKSFKLTYNMLENYSRDY